MSQERQQKGRNMYKKIKERDTHPIIHTSKVVHVSEPRKWKIDGTPYIVVGVWTDPEQTLQIVRFNIEDRKEEEVQQIKSEAAKFVAEMKGQIKTRQR